MTAPTVVTTQPAATQARHTAFGDFTIRVAAGIVILVLWEVLCRAYAPPFVARPTGIIAAFPSVMANPTFWAAAKATLTAVFEGLAIAFVAGTILGVGIGRVRMIDRFSSLYISGLFAMPLTAILPLFSLWFGYTADARLAVVVFASFFSVVTNVSDGARAVPIEYIEVSRSFRGRAISRLFDVILPASVPDILAGLRLACAGVLFEIALRKATAKWLPWYRRGTGD